MKKLTILTTILFFALAFQSYAYIECTPDDCPDGYTEGDTTCIEGVCTKECYFMSCNVSDGTWEEVYSDTTSIEWVYTNNSRRHEETGGYTPPSSTEYCYKYEYQGPPAESYEIRTKPNPTRDPSCTTESIGVFYSSSKWYSSMTNSIGDYVRYLGDTTTPSNTYYGNGRLQVMRASDDNSAADRETDQEYRDTVAVTTHVYCAPTEQVCDDIANNYTNNCATGCYSQATNLMVAQNYLQYSTSNDYTLFRRLACNPGTVWNNMRYPEYHVYRTNLNLTISNDSVCYTPMNISSVKVLPLNATTGDDLICNYTYEDPRKLSEQNSTYEWWKNGVNQNIDSKILGNANLSVDDSWFCKVTAGNGVSFSSQMQSENNVTILETVQNPKMFVSDSEVWSKDGYYSGSEWAYDFVSEIQSYLDSCTADGEGMCSVPLTFYSGASGAINISGIEIYYISEEEEEESAQNVSISSLIPFYEDRFLKVFEIGITGEEAYAGLNWSLNSGDGMFASSIIDYNLSASEEIAIITEANYSQFGFYTATASAGLNSEVWTDTQDVQVQPINVSSIALLNQEGSKALFELMFSNYWDATPSIIDWSMQTGTEQLDTEQDLNVSLGESVAVIIQYNYTSSGTHNTNTSIHNGTAVDYAEYQITI